MNNVGFTGTTRGMTERQGASVLRLLRVLFEKDNPARFHHGGEPHSDAEAALLALTIGYEVLEHPGGTAAQNLARNRDIVDISRVLVAAPRGRGEVLRSGTWATIRYAKGVLQRKPPGGSRPVIMVWPDGKVKIEPARSGGA